MIIHSTLILFLMLALSPEDSQNNVVRKGLFQKTLILQGEIISPKSEKFYTPRTKTWEIQLEWMLPEATAVEPGDVVVRFDNSAVKDELESTMNDLLTKEGDRDIKEMEIEQERQNQEFQLKEADIALKKAQIEASIPKGLEELRTFQEKQLAVAKAEKELEKRKTKMAASLTNAATDMKILELGIRELEKKVQNAEADQEKLQLKATTSGIFVWGDHPWEGRKLQLGESVQPSWAVARIPAMEDMEVEAYAAESEVGQIKKGQTVTLIPDAYPNLSMEAVVVAVANNAVKRDRFGKAPYFRIGIKPENVDTTVIKPGMSVRSSILLTRLEDMLLIPIQMIRFQNGSYYVKPMGGELLKIEPAGFNNFYVAVHPSESSLKEGDSLEAATGE